LLCRIICKKITGSEPLGEQMKLKEIKKKMGGSLEVRYGMNIHHSFKIVKDI
jgi:hypothetical protein